MRPDALAADPPGRAVVGTRLGVVVVNYNTADLLDECLASVKAEMAAARLDATVWVVDNASSDGSADIVRQRHAWAHLVPLASNAGYAAACNLALAAFLGGGTAPPTEAPLPDFALVLNADVSLRQGAVTALIAAMRDRPDAAVAGPRLAYPDGTFQHAAFRFPGLVQTWLDLFPVDRLADRELNGRYPRRRYDDGQPFDVDFPLGACMLVRTSAVRAVGLMDEGYFLYCEEVDWCRRFRSAGYAVLCVPNAVAVHHAGASTRAMGRSQAVALWRSRLRYFSKFEPAWRYALLATVIRLGLRLHGVRGWAAADASAGGTGRGSAT